MERFLNFFDDIVGVMVSPERSFRELLDKNIATRGIYVFIFFAAFLGVMVGALIAGIAKKRISTCLTCSGLRGLRTYKNIYMGGNFPFGG